MKLKKLFGAAGATAVLLAAPIASAHDEDCLLYTSDAADE